ncbi:MAG: YgjV family protein [Ruminococcaceae bacterium]|nr:YgjV family protein [Oscillospiraceae bacterium]
MTVPEIIGQVFGILSTVMTCISYQCNTKQRILAVQSLSVVFICINYALLGATAGLVLNIVCLVRNVIFYFQKEGSRFQLISGCLLAIALGVCGVFSWQGPISLLMIVALAANTVVLSFGKPQLLRISIFFTSTLVLIYNVYFLSIGGILNECVAILSAAVGLIRFYKKKER